MQLHHEADYEKRLNGHMTIRRRNSKCAGYLSMRLFAWQLVLVALTCSVCIQANQFDAEEWQDSGDNSVHHDDAQHILGSLGYGSLDNLFNSELPLQQQGGGVCPSCVFHQSAFAPNVEQITKRIRADLLKNNNKHIEAFTLGTAILEIGHQRSRQISEEDKLLLMNTCSSLLGPMACRGKSNVLNYNFCGSISR